MIKHTLKYLYEANLMKGGNFLAGQNIHPVSWSNALLTFRREATSTYRWLRWLWPMRLLSIQRILLETECTYLMAPENWRGKDSKNLFEKKTLRKNNLRTDCALHKPFLVSWQATFLLGRVQLCPDYQQRDVHLGWKQSDFFSLHLR